MKEFVLTQEVAFDYFDDLRKQGYSSIGGFPTWLMNEYRVSRYDALMYFNRYIKARNLKEECFYICKTHDRTQVITESMVEKLKKDLSNLTKNLSASDLKKVRVEFIKPE